MEHNPTVQLSVTAQEVTLKLTPGQSFEKLPHLYFSNRSRKDQTTKSLCKSSFNEFFSFMFLVLSGVSDVEMEEAPWGEGSLLRFANRAARYEKTLQYSITVLNVLFGRYYFNILLNQMFH